MPGARSSPTAYGRSMPRWMATEEDEHEAVQRLLVGLSSSQDVFELSATISELHRKNDTFPGEVYVRLAAEVLADTRAAGAGPIEYEGLREVHLEEVELRGKENRKFQYAVLCSASIAGLDLTSSTRSSGGAPTTSGDTRSSPPSLSSERAQSHASYPSATSSPSWRTDAA